jgi:hypothetical protein
MLQEVMKNVEMSFPNSDPLVDPVEGLPCVAVFPEDRIWYLLVPIGLLLGPFLLLKSNL